jgi:hypothetical protein
VRVQAAAAVVDDEWLHRKFVIRFVKRKSSDRWDP